jgi:hypothetical protein
LSQTRFLIVLQHCGKLPPDSSLLSGAAFSPDQSKFAFACGVKEPDAKTGFWHDIKEANANEKMEKVVVRPFSFVLLSQLFLF